MVRRTLVFVAFLAATFAAVPANAQYRGSFAARNPATGETYHVETRFGYWNPTPDLWISTEPFGPLGAQILDPRIDAVTDLGVQRKRFIDLHLILRPARKHKFGIDYIPIKYEAEAVLTRDIVFNGVTYTVTQPIQSTLDWKFYRFSYEYDFVYRDRWYLGFMVDVKYNRVAIALDSPGVRGSAAVTAPIPALGGVVRVYPVSNLSFTAEATAFRWPRQIIKEYRGGYIDYDLYMTANIGDHFGTQAGYRSLDVGYAVKGVSGDFRLSGWYLAAVTRF
jgi:hypothetical protein